MGKMIALKIDLSKVPGITVKPNSQGKIFLDVSDPRIFKGKNGAIYLDLIVFENDKPDAYDNDYAVKPSQSKESREAGEKAPYIGNGKNLGGRPQSQAPRNREQYKTTPAESESAGFNNGDDIPF